VAGVTYPASVNVNMERCGMTSTGLLWNVVRVDRHVWITAGAHEHHYEGPTTELASEYATGVVDALRLLQPGASDDC
jgi:hypothetical protein